MLQERWQIRLLGGLSATCGSRTLTRFQTRQTGLLLAYLAHFLNRRHPREALIELLWPDSDLDSARNRFRVALSSLRRQLEPPGVQPNSVLASDRSSVKLNADACEVDSATFQRLVERAGRAVDSAAAFRALVEASNLSRGQFLQGWDAEWIDPERATIARLQVEAELRLARLYEDQGNLTQALQHGQRATAAEPLMEPPRRAVIRILLKLGRREAAALELRDFRRLLRSELGLDASSETLRLLEGIHRGPSRVPGAQELVVAEPTLRPEPGPRLTNQSTDAAVDLPIPLNSFIAREDDVAAIGELLLVERIVTLTGSGGAGKSRLAVESARAVQDRFGAGIWFVPLTNVSGPALVVSAILERMGREPLPNEDSLRQIAEHVSTGGADSKRDACLLILDCFEHMPVSANAILVALLREIPKLTLLVTSRRRLGVIGECEYPVRPLAIPDEDASGDLGRLAAVESVRLFIERAQSVQPDFQLTASNADAIGEVCKRLDGLPLALEIAAAKIRQASPRQMMQELPGLESLVDSRAWREPRHQSLRATLEWSYQMLSAEDRELFRQLSVFPESWNGPAAEAVCGGPAVKEGLRRLVEHSLVICEETDLETRFRMLQLVREFAASKLSPEERTRLDDQHGKRFVDAATEYEALMLTVGFPDKRPLWRDKENFRKALERYISSPEGLGWAATIASSLTWFWIRTNCMQEGRDWMERILAADREFQSLTRVLRARVRLAVGCLACYQDEMALSVALIRDALEELVSLSAWTAVAHGRWALGFAMYGVGEFGEAIRMLNESLLYFDEYGHSTWIAAALNMLGFAYCEVGDYDRALDMFARNDEIWTANNDRDNYAFLELGRARIAWRRGELEKAHELYARVVRTFPDREQRRGVAYAVEGLARVKAAQRQWEPATQLFGAAKRLREEMSLRQDAADLQAHEACVAALSHNLGDRMGAEWQLGYSVPPRAIVEWVLERVAS